MKFIITLLWARLRDRKIALSLIVLATMATSLLIALVGGIYQLAGARIDKNVKKVIGPVDRIIISGTIEDWEAEKTRYATVVPKQSLDSKLIDFIKQNKKVKSHYFTAYAKVEVLNPKRKYSGSMYMPGYVVNMPIFATVDDAMPPEFLAPGITPEKWQECVKNSQPYFPEIKDRKSGKIRYQKGSEILLTSVNKNSTFTIGEIYKPTGDLRNFGGLFVSQKMFKEITGADFRVNRVFIDFGENIDEKLLADFDQQFYSLEQQLATPAAVISAQTYIDEQVEAAMSKKGGFGLLPFSGTVLTIIGAFFIILHAVSIGNRLQIKESLNLKAIGAPAKQLSTLAFLEAIIPAIIGCIIGLIIARIIYGLGIQENRGGMYLATENIASGIYNQALFSIMPLCFIVAIFSSLFAVFPVAWQILRNHPLEYKSITIGDDTDNYQRKTFLGIVLLFLNPILTIAPGISDDIRMLLVPLSYIATLIGVLLILPMLTKIIRLLTTTLFARIFLLKKTLVADFLRIHSAKIVAGTATMLIGLGLFIAIFIWGNSMKAPFVLTEKSPDASVVMFPQGVNNAQLQQLKSNPMFTKFVPLHLNHLTISDNQVKNIKLVGGDWRDLLYIGCDLAEVFEEKNGIIKGNFIRGNAEEAFAAVKENRGVVITAELYRSNPDIYDLGKVIETQDVDTGKVVLHKIVGVVDFIGWHMFTKSARMRRGLGRLAGMIFVSPQTTLKHYPESTPRCFWMNVDEKLTKTVQTPPREKSPKTMQNKNVRRGPNGRPPAVSAIQKNIEKIFSRFQNRGGYIRAVDISEMTKSVERRSNMVIMALSKVPFLALLLSSIAVAATVSSTIQSRKKEIGVLRAIGMSSFQLFRLLFIESIIMTIVATILGVIFGLLVSWSGIIISASGWGIGANYIIPWKMIFIGAVISLATGITGALLPTILATKKRPHALLSAEDEQ